MCQICFEVDRGVFEIFEDFLGFAKLKVTDEKTITDRLISKLSKWGINLANLRGKGFDGATTMSGHISGVQARLRMLNISHIVPVTV